MLLKNTIEERTKAECAEQIQACFQSKELYREVLADCIRRGLLPGEAKRLLDHMSAHPPSDNSGAALEAHAAAIARVRAIVDAPEIQNQARRSVEAAFLKLREPVLKLEEAAAASIGKQFAELVEAERAFAASYGMERFETPVSRVAASLLASIRNHSFSADRERITGNTALCPAPILDLGGLQVLLAG